MISEMSDHIPDDIGKRVDAETSGSCDTESTVHKYFNTKNPHHYRKNEGKVKVIY